MKEQNDSNLDWANEFIKVDSSARFNIKVNQARNIQPGRVYRVRRTSETFPSFYSSSLIFKVPAVTRQIPHPTLPGRTISDRQMYSGEYYSELGENPLVGGIVGIAGKPRRVTYSLDCSSFNIRQIKGQYK